MGILGILIAFPWLALLPAAVFAVYAYRGQRLIVCIAAALWVGYAAYETAMLHRILCSGECNIRVDLLLLYPVLFAVSLAAARAIFRTRRPVHERKREDDWLGARVSGPVLRRSCDAIAARSIPTDDRSRGRRARRPTCALGLRLVLYGGLGRRRRSRQTVSSDSRLMNSALARIRRAGMLNSSLPLRRC